MRMEFRVAVGGLGAVGLMVLALWGWHEAGALVSQWARPEVGVWAVRSAAVGVAAAAQVIALTFVLGGVYGRDRGAAGEVLRLSAGLVCSLAVVSSIALGLAGR